MSKASPSASSIVVPSRSVTPDASDEQKLRMAARDEQQQIGRPQAFGQADRQRVRLEMIDGEKWLASARAPAPCRSSTPTISPPIRPGPAVAAMPARSAKPTPASRQGRARSVDRGTRHGRARRSPAQPRHRRVLVELREHDVGENAARPGPSRATTAAAVSSQLVSRPRTSVQTRARSRARRRHCCRILAGDALDRRMGINGAAGTAGLAARRLAPGETALQAAPSASAPEARPWRWLRRMRCGRLDAAHGLPEAAFEIVVIKTTGDQCPTGRCRISAARASLPRKSKRRCWRDEIDVAVHSMKDMQTVLPTGWLSAPSCRARTRAMPS